MMSSLRDDWETPQDLFDALDARYGFTVDVCANDGNAKCARYYTPDDDGLSRSWEGEVAWCNPPYGRAIAAWARKCAEESRRARVVMLCAARPDTRWFAEHVAPHARVAFVVGRLRFERGGAALDAAPFPSMLAFYGEEPNVCLVDRLGREVGLTWS